MLSLGQVKVSLEDSTTQVQSPPQGLEIRQRGKLLKRHTTPLEIVYHREHYKQTGGPSKLKKQMAIFHTFPTF